MLFVQGNFLRIPDPVQDKLGVNVLGHFFGQRWRNGRKIQHSGASGGQGMRGAVIGTILFATVKTSQRPGQTSVLS